MLFLLTLISVLHKAYLPKHPPKKKKRKKKRKEKRKNKKTTYKPLLGKTKTKPNARDYCQTQQTCNLQLSLKKVKS